jgi:hypothetical protein
VSSSCKCLVAEKLPDQKGPANRLLVSSTSNNGMSCLRLAEDRMQPFGIRQIYPPVLIPPEEISAHPSGARAGLGVRFRKCNGLF